MTLSELITKYKTITEAAKDEEMILVSVEDLRRLVADVDRPVATLKEALKSLEWYRDVFNGPDGEFEHFWKVELPHHLETNLKELGEFHE